MMRGFLALVWLLLSLQVHAAVGPWGSDGPVQARLISDTDGLAGREELLLGLQIRLEPGWKTYWRVPGAAGAAPSLNLDHPMLDPEPRWHWPAPQRFDLQGLQSYGYAKEVVLPIRYRLNTSVDRFELSGQASVFACKEVCLPLSVPVSLSLPGGGATDWSSQRLLNRYMAREPLPLADQLQVQSATVDDGGLYLELQLTRMGTAPDLFIENLEVHDWSSPQISVDGNRVRLWWQRPDGAPELELKNPVRFTYVDELQAYTGAVNFATGARPQPEAGLERWLTMLLFAWLGGLILNVMPCVLPVLSLKLMHLSKSSGLAVREVRLQLLLTALGIISFFWLLALALIGLKLSGQYIGWGIQYQNPYFLLFMLLLMLLFSANLLGWFEFVLPVGWLLRLAGDSQAASASPHFASFMQGVTATLLATPCSAPFLGTAVAFALAQPPLALLLLFSALGLGLATPYFLLLARPALIRRLPKPGPWMVRVRVVLALGMLATAGWILWLLRNHLSAELLLALALAAAAWLLLWRLRHLYVRRSQWILAGLLFLFIPLGGNSQSVAQPDWQPFDPARIERRVAEGRLLLVDITADWCITCKYNKAMVLDTAAVQDLLHKHQVEFMQGDWTRPDAAIEAFLQQHGRAGIPFNAVFGPGAPDGILLPELLTEQALAEAIAKAAAPTIAARD